MLAYILFQWQNRLNKAKTSRLWILLGGIFFIWTLLQSVPLPAELIEKLSPFRYRALSDGATLAGIDFNPSSLSYNRFTSLGWWILLLSVAMFFIVLRNTLNDSRRLRLVIRIVLILAALEAFYGIIQALVPTVGVLWTNFAYIGDARGTYINRNHFAGFIEMAFPLCLGYTLSLGDWSVKNKKEKQRLKSRLSSDQFSPPLLLGVILVMMLVALLFSRSRAGIAGMGIGFLVFTLLVRLGSGRLPMGFLLGAIAIFGLVFLYGARIGFESIIDRFLMLEGGGRTRDDCKENRGNRIEGKDSGRWSGKDRGQRSDVRCQNNGVQNLGSKNSINSLQCPHTFYP